MQTINEVLTWEEIVDRYSGKYVGVVEIVHEKSLSGIKTARVMYLSEQMSEIDNLTIDGTIDLCIHVPQYATFHGLQYHERGVRVI